MLKTNHGANEVKDDLVLNAIDNGIMAINRKGMIVFLNRASERIFTIKKEEVLGKYALDVFPNVGRLLLETLTSKKKSVGIQVSGEKTNVISNISPIEIENKVVGVLAVFQETSELEEMTREPETCKETVKMLETFIESSYDGLCITNGNGTIIRMNEAIKRINGFKSNEEILGRNIADLVTEGVIDKAVTLEALHKRAQVTMVQNVRGSRKVLVTSTPIFNEDGQISLIVSNLRDITELNKLREQLEESRAISERYRSELLEAKIKEAEASNIIFRSKQMNEVIDTALKVAKVDSTVLLLGESGVGKEVIAKLIHKSSPRAEISFIVVNCGAIPEALMESELFGYEKGAFTGARTDGSPGYLELADKGTLFLDEIADLPLPLQVKLLRFIENSELIRVGGRKVKTIDTRIIAATNANLEERVKAKRFRDDLYFRLNVIPIPIPPLRERKEDIPPLVNYYLTKFCVKFGLKKTISSEAMDMLTEYPFPGNIRELSNIIERLIVMVTGNRIDASDLPGAIKKTFPFPGEITVPEGACLPAMVAELESKVIQIALKRYKSQQKIAEALGVTQPTIARKIKKYLGHITIQ